MTTYSVEIQVSHSPNVDVRHSDSEPPIRDTQEAIPFKRTPSAQNLSLHARA